MASVKRYDISKISEVDRLLREVSHQVIQAVVSRLDVSFPPILDAPSPPKEGYIWREVPIDVNRLELLPLLIDRLVEDIATRKPVQFFRGPLHPVAPVIRLEYKGVALRFQFLYLPTPMIVVSYMASRNMS